MVAVGEYDAAATLARRWPGSAALRNRTRYPRHRGVRRCWSHANGANGYAWPESGRATYTDTCGDAMATCHPKAIPRADACTWNGHQPTNVFPCPGKRNGADCHSTRVTGTAGYPGA